MKPANLFKFAYLAYLSKPAEERHLYRALRRAKPTSIVEIGVGDGVRGQRLLSVAARYSPDATLRYAGIDLFEGRPAGCPGLTLKQAHKLFNSAAKTQLFPGDAFSALARAANRLTETDLLIIAGDQDPDALERAWYYVPRMLHEHSLVFVQAPSAGDEPGRYELLTPAEIQLRVKRPAARRAA